MAATAACRILVVSSTTDTAHQFVQRVKALSNPPSSDEGPSNTSTQVASSQPPTQTGGGLSELHAQLTNSEPAVSIPWTISNKYYTADVHFEIRQLDGFAGYLASEVPAVVYVWDRKEQHKEEIPELAKKLQHYDPEVSLAVRFACDSGSEGGDEGEDGLDEFISSHGFEYVDGERGRRIPTGDVSSFSDEDSAGVPGLPRVIDALSTIMWPSLVQTQRTSSRRKSRGGDLLDWASIEDPHGTNGEAPLLQNKDLTSRQSRLKKEMDELESWLQDELDASQAEDEDDDLGSSSKKDHDDPWSTAHGREVDGYHGLHFGGEDGDEHKFDDDFDDFVGAPMDVTYGDSRSPARDTTTRYPVSLAVSHSSSNTASTSKAPHRAFTSDFVTFTDRDVAHEDEIEEDEEDEEMPSRAEIEEMSRQLFGSAGSLAVPSTSSEWQRLHSPSIPSNSTELPPPAPHPTADSNTGESNFERLGAEEDEEEEDFELGAFDLSKVLGALQGMKEQIAGMEDEGERRRAAAKVALGLVYGLQKEEERDSQRA